MEMFSCEASDARGTETYSTLMLFGSPNSFCTHFVIALSVTDPAPSGTSPRSKISTLSTSLPSALVFLPLPQPASNPLTATAPATNKLICFFIIISPFYLLTFNRTQCYSLYKIFLSKGVYCHNRNSSKNNACTL